MNRIKLLSTVILLNLLCSFVFAQNRQIQGVVRDDQGTLPGAAISEKGIDNNRTSTNADGKFTITLRGESNTIIVNYVGYITKEVNIGTSSNVTVTLVSNTNELEQVVIVGYGSQKKITLSGSVSTVTGEEIRQSPAASLQNTLAGRATGFISQQRLGRPGLDGAEFLIRGQSSLNGANSPLIIMDDIEISYDQFSRLEANEVESINFLKDASTTAIYGIKGANGVLVLTSRRGRVGPAKISFRTDYALAEPTRLPEYLDSYNTALLYNQAQINDNMYSASPVANFKPKWTDADLELFKNGQDPYGHPNVDWYNMLFKKFAPQSKSNIDLSGGTEKARYFVSLGYLDQGGATKDYSEGQGYNGSYYNRRYNYRSNLDLAINKTLDLKLDISGSFSEINQPYVQNGSVTGQKNDIFYEYNSFLGLAPWAYAPINPDGSFGYSNWQKNEAGGANYNSNNIIARMTYGGYIRNNENQMVLNTSANQKLDFITPGLSLKGVVAYQSSLVGNVRRLSRQDFIPSFIYNPTTNTYEPRDQNVFRLERPGVNTNTPGTTRRNLTLQAHLNYDRTFGNHNVKGLVLVNQQSDTRAGDVTYNFIPANTRGYTARLNYDFKEKYILQVAGAYNGTDRFVGKKRFGFFPSVSGAWVLSNEGFIKNNLKFIDLFKLRGSYGLTGSDQLGGGFSYAYQQVYTNASGIPGNPSFGITHNNYNGLVEGRLPNTDVTWDKYRQLSVALEYGLFKKLSGTIEYFDNFRYDQLISRGTISNLFGQDLPPVNLGESTNSGLDIDLTFKDKIGKDFGYSIKGVYSLARNKVVFRDEQSQEFPWQYLTGHPIGSTTGYKFIGFYKSLEDVANSPKVVPSARPGDLKYADLNGDNLIDARDKSVVGFPNTPNTTYGLTLAFDYKNFSLNTLFQGSANFNVGGYEEGIRAFSSNLTAIHQQAWTPELGDNAKYPLMSLGRGISDPTTNGSDFWNVKGDFLRLRNVQLAYTLPTSLLQKIKIPSAKVYLSGTNLFLWTRASKLYQFDPEIQSGLDRAPYPPQRIYNLGLSISFN